MFSMAEALWLLDEGHAIEDVDRIMKDWGLPMGPFALMDEVGIDVAVHVAHIVGEAFSDRLALPEWLDGLTADGRLGTKAGKGIYRYDKGERRGVDPAVYEIIGRQPSGAPADADLVADRLILPMVNEAARCLDEGSRGRRRLAGPGDDPGHRLPAVPRRSAALGGRAGAGRARRDHGAARPPRWRLASRRPARSASGRRAAASTADGRRGPSSAGVTAGRSARGPRSAAGTGSATPSSARASAGLVRLLQTRIRGEQTRQEPIMHRMPRLTAVLALAVAAAAFPATAAAAAAQEQQGQQERETPAGRFGERIQVTEVLLDVLVTDADGNVVVGLDAGDFVIEEKGRPVEVGSARFYGSARLGEALSGAATAPADRFFILFFHDLRREAPELLRQQRDAATQSRHWVEESLGENDWVAVVSYYAKLRIHQDFTRDRGAILAGLDSVARGEDPGATWTAAAQLGDGPSLTRHLAQGKELRRLTPRLEDGLKVLADAAARLQGRKNLVLFSIGFGEVDRFGWKPDRRYYPRTERALNDANVAVYPIALAGGPFGRDPVIEALGQSLSQLAADTGGRYFQSFASFTAPLEQVAADNAGYYLLSYSAEYPAGDSGYREVDVRTTNPALRVRARNGYLYGG